MLDIRSDQIRSEELACEKVSLMGLFGGKCLLLEGGIGAFLLMDGA